MAEVWLSIAVSAAVPEAFFGIDIVVAKVIRLIEPNAVEDEELCLGPKLRGVG
jgi:hypothetical protein